MATLPRCPHCGSAIRIGVSLPHPNRIWSPEDVERVRQFVALSYPTTTEAVWNLATTTLNLDVTMRATREMLTRYKISVGRADLNVLHRPDIIARIKRRIARSNKNKRTIGNLGIVRMVKREFGVDVTIGQVAGVLHREGIVRLGKMKQQRKPGGTTLNPRALPRQPDGRFQAQPESPAAIDMPIPEPERTVESVIHPTAMRQPVQPPAPPEAFQEPAKIRSAENDICSTPGCGLPVYKRRPYCVDCCGRVYMGFKAEKVALEGPAR